MPTFLPFTSRDGHLCKVVLYHENFLKEYLQKFNQCLNYSWPPWVTIIIALCYNMAKPPHVSPHVPFMCAYWVFLFCFMLLFLIFLTLSIFIQACHFLLSSICLISKGKKTCKEKGLENKTGFSNNYGPSLFTPCKLSVAYCLVLSYSPYCWGFRKSNAQLS